MTREELLQELQDRGYTIDRIEHLRNFDLLTMLAREKAEEECERREMLAEMQAEEEKQYEDALLVDEMWVEGLLKTL